MTQPELVHSMNVTEWLRAAVIGLVIGAGLTAFLGFSYGGWTTEGKANELAVEQTKLGVAEALAPFCVQRAKADPTYASKLEALKAGNSYNQTAIIKDSGWATRPGQSEPNDALAAAGQVQLAAAL
jgi:hypothetical protein